MATIDTVRAVFGDARPCDIYDAAAREAVRVGSWYAVLTERGWIACQERDGTFSAPLPKASRSGGTHTSFAKQIGGLQTTAYESAVSALQSVLGDDEQGGYNLA